MFIEVDFEQIQINRGEGKAFIQLKNGDNSVTISKQSGIINGLNVIGDIKVNLADHLQELWERP